MALTAYHPLQAVYAFHEMAEVWILRRYASAVTVDADGEPRTLSYQEAPIQVFRDPRARQGLADQTGQIDTGRCVVYLRQQLRPVESGSTAAPQPADVLFDVAGSTGAPGSAWIVQELRGWRDALGFEAVLVRQGQRGLPPWA